MSKKVQAQVGWVERERERETERGRFEGEAVCLAGDLQSHEYRFLRRDKIEAIILDTWQIRRCYTA